MTAFLDGPGPRAFAHRGWHIDELAGCENSMAAFARAADEGFRYLETDVHATADGVLVAFHDSVLDRVSNGSGPVSGHQWAALRDVRISGREPIPLFDELLQLLADRPALRLNVDPKADTAVGPLVDAVHASGMVDRICVGAFSDARIAAVSAALGPDLATSLGPRAVGRLTLASRLRRPLHPPRPAAQHPVAAQIPVRIRRLTVLTPALLATAHAAGLEVHVWTIDESSTMERLLELGVDGIMTDRPDRLRDVLRARGQWRPDPELVPVTPDPIGDRT